MHCAYSVTTYLFQHRPTMNAWPVWSHWVFSFEKTYKCSFVNLTVIVIFPSFRSIVWENVIRCSNNDFCCEINAANKKIVLHSPTFDRLLFVVINLFQSNRIDHFGQRPTIRMLQILSRCSVLLFTVRQTFPSTHFIGCKVNAIGFGDRFVFFSPSFVWSLIMETIISYQLSQFPSNFILKEIRSENDQSQQMSIDFKRSDCLIPLEKLTYGHIDQENDFKEFLPQQVVTCETYLDNCTIALLLDSLVDKANRSVWKWN